MKTQGTKKETTICCDFLSFFRILFNTQLKALCFRCLEGACLNLMRLSHHWIDHLSQCGHSIKDWSHSVYSSCSEDFEQGQHRLLAFKILLFFTWWQFYKLHLCTALQSQNSLGLLGVQNALPSSVLEFNETVV